MNILPANTIVVGLTYDDEEILRRMKPKTRYNIKLALRHGIEVRSTGIRGLQTWHSLYIEMAVRNGLHINDIEYFRSMFAPKMDAECTDVDMRLLVAYYGDKPLAAMFLVMSAHRATYLYGASSSSMRNLMPTYALQWAAIQTDKRNKCREYDMFGIAPNGDPSHPMHGLYKFKRGFGGEIFHQLGCWDYPIDNTCTNGSPLARCAAQGYYS